MRVSVSLSVRQSIPRAAVLRPDLLRHSRLQQFSPPPSSPVLNTLTHPIPADIPPPATSPHPGPISLYVFLEALPSRTPRSDSQWGPLQPIREVIHTLPHLSYLLYYHPGWPIPHSYPLRPGAQAGYPGFQPNWQCPSNSSPPFSPHPLPSCIMTSAATSICSWHSMGGS